MLLANSGLEGMVGLESIVDELCIKFAAIQTSVKELKMH